jgi:hypothetical protein
MSAVLLVVHARCENLIKKHSHISVVLSPYENKGKNKLKIWIICASSSANQCASHEKLLYTKHNTVTISITNNQQNSPTARSSLRVTEEVEVSLGGSMLYHVQLIVSVQWLINLTRYCATSDGSTKTDCQWGL